MKLWLTKVGDFLQPTDTDGAAFIAKMGAGECVVFEATRPRSVSWLRMYFALCKSIGENQDPPRDEASIDAELRIRAGHFDVLLFDGLEVRVPKRIAFAEMDADAWADYWQRAEVVIRERFGNEYIAEAQWT